VWRQPDSTGGPRSRVVRRGYCSLVDCAFVGLTRVLLVARCAMRGTGPQRPADAPSTGWHRASAGPCAKSKTLAGGSRACFRPPRPPCFATSGALTVGRERTRSTRRVSCGRLSRPRPAQRTRESKWARVPVPRPGRAHGRGWASGHVALRTLPRRPVLLGMQVRVRGRGAIPQPAHRVVQ
jgi:hypothetical protein